LGLAQLLQDKPVDGDHWYVDAPLADNDTDEPKHISLSSPAFTVGLVFTVTVITPVSVQPLASVPVAI
jgi:hypothetical protein